MKSNRLSPEVLSKPYQPVIGLEVHVELLTKTKMFCSCPNDLNEKHPNINVCPICFGHPGVLPTINKEAVKKVLTVGLALNGEIAEFSRFDRKHYFYPDLPKGYQISQYQHPLVLGGYLEIPNFKKVRIMRIHLEEDTGTLEHKENSSLVDYNRAGVPLMELVTEPDIFSAYEAKRFAEEFQLILRYLNVSRADMEKGQMRVEANISLSDMPHPTVGKMGTKVEIKNLNSFRAVEKAIDYEIKRQAETLESGGKIKQETRGWNEKKEITFSQRSKEEAEDYRYFPEPDLPTMEVGSWMSDVRLPELPNQKRERFKKEYGIKNEAIEILVSDKNLADYFEKIASELIAWLESEPSATGNRVTELINLAVNYLTTDLLGLMKEKELPVNELLITPENFSELIKMAADAKISSRGAKDILLEMFKTGEDPHILAEQMNLSQTSDEKELEEAAKKVIELNRQAAADFKKGKPNALQFLIGQMMKQTKGKANPQISAKLLTKILGGV